MEPNPPATASQFSVLYALPVPRFFSQHSGVGGHVAHATGVMEALVHAGARLTVLAAEKPSFAVAPAEWHVLPCPNAAPWPRFLWGRRLVAVARAAAVRGHFAFCYARFAVQFAPLVPSFKAALGAVPLVLEVNSFGTQAGGPRGRLVAPFERRALRAADLVVAVSEVLRARIEDLAGPEAAARVTVIPNGVSAARFPGAPAAEPVCPRAARLCYCGVLKENYGLEALLRVHGRLTALHPELELHLVGDGPARRRLEASPARGSNVIFHGAVTHEAVPAILSEMDVLVYTTSRENVFQSPIKLYEYMAAGRPIVAAGTPQVRAVLDGDRPGGAFFPVEDEGAMFAVLAAVLANPAAAGTMALRARELVVAGHTWDCRIRDLRRALAERGLAGV